MVEKYFGNSYAWLNINVEGISDYSEISQTYQIDQTLVKYALYEYKMFNSKHYQPKEPFVVNFNILKDEKRKNGFVTASMTFFIDIEDGKIITFSNKYNEYIIKAMEKELERRPDISLYTFLFSTLMIITEDFFSKIESLKKYIEVVNLKFREKDDFKSFEKCLELDIAIDYLVVRIKQNVIMMEHLKNYSWFKTLDIAEKEEYENSLIREKQLVEVISIIQH